MPNLNFIKEHGIEEFVGQQKRRIRLLEAMIEDFDDGRSRGFYCRSVALLDLTALENSLDKAIRKAKAVDIRLRDTKTRARILGSVLSGIALVPLQ